jgi:hypothetical protein
VLRMRVVDAPAGARVTVRCLGKRCRFERRKATVRANGAADLHRLVRRPLMPVGSTLEVRIVAANRLGKVVRFKIKRGRIPDGRRLCLPPGTTKPTRCRRSLRGGADRYRSMRTMTSPPCVRPVDWKPRLSQKRSAPSSPGT